jgi:ubiquinone/menaquinone biosynthesis C-methylase UbiE
MKPLDPQQGFARYAKTYDNLEKYWNSFEQRKLEPYIEQAGEPAELMGSKSEGRHRKKVLDAGAGTGRLSLKLQKVGAYVTALDISPDMLEKLSRKDDGNGGGNTGGNSGGGNNSGDSESVDGSGKRGNRIELVEGDVEDMPFEDDTFDMVFSSLTLVHLKKIEPFLDECYRVLKDDGVLVLVNIHYRKPMILEDDKGRYTIACYNHFPRHVRQAAEKLAFGVEEEMILTEGDDVWISQILVLKK